MRSPPERAKFRAQILSLLVSFFFVEEEDVFPSPSLDLRVLFPDGWSLFTVFIFGALTPFLISLTPRRVRPFVRLVVRLFSPHAKLESFPLALGDVSGLGPEVIYASYSLDLQKVF